VSPLQHNPRVPQVDVVFRKTVDGQVAAEPVQKVSVSHGPVELRHNVVLDLKLHNQQTLVIYCYLFFSGYSRVAIRRSEPNLEGQFWFPVTQKPSFSHTPREARHLAPGVKGPTDGQEGEDPEHVRGPVHGDTAAPQKVPAGLRPQTEFRLLCAIATSQLETRNSINLMIAWFVNGLCRKFYVMREATYLKRPY
jgi:hypothetical protein